MDCHEPCELSGANPEATAREERASKKKKRQPQTAKPCCGSMGGRHKKDCPGEKSERPVKAGEATFICDTCSHEFLENLNSEGLNECPECKGTNVWKKQNKSS